MVWGTAINIAGKLAGGLLGNKSADKSSDRQAQLDQQNWKHARDQFEQGIQYRVKDATKAGLHPLFALGYSGSGSGGVHAGTSPTGNAFADGLQNLNVPNEPPPRPAGTKSSPLQTRLLAAQVRSAEARASSEEFNLAQAKNSSLAKLTTRAAAGASFDSANGATSYGLGPQQSFSPTPLRAKQSTVRPLEREPHLDSPLNITVVDDGGRPYRVLNPDHFDEATSPAFLDYLRQYVSGGNMGRDIKSRLRDTVPKGYWRN